MRVRGLKRAEAVSISSQLSVSPFERKSEKRIVLHLSLTFIRLVVSFARSENEESTKQKMKRIVFAVSGFKIYIKVILFYLYF